MIQYGAAQVNTYLLKNVLEVAAIQILPHTPNRGRRRDQNAGSCTAQHVAPLRLFENKKLTSRILRRKVSYS
jgi:hypothetical protein